MDTFFDTPAVDLLDYGEAYDLYYWSDDEKFTLEDEIMPDATW